jgi:iron complex outermembrane recepter protein
MTYPRLIRFITALVLGSLTARGQTAETGAIRGTVSNAATRAYIHGATVRVVGSDLVAFTESDGAFYLGGVPAGAQKIAIDYTGLDSQAVPIAIPRGGTAVVDVSLSSTVYKMDQFVVATAREGEAYALTRSTSSAVPPTSRMSFRPTPSETPPRPTSATS